MKNKALIFGSMFAVGIVVAALAIGIVSGFPAARPVAAPDATAPFISIDPIPAKSTGDLLIVTGTTSYPEGTEFIIKIAPPAGSDDRAPHVGSMAKVFTGGGINRFSCPVDTSILKPGELLVSVTNWIRDPVTGNLTRGDTTGTVLFTLEGSYLGAEPPSIPPATGYITLDPIGIRHAGEQFLVTGSTDLTVGTEVLWEVSPASFPANPDQTGTFSGMMANSEVTRGSGGTNRVSLAVDTNVLLPGQYNVTVSTMPEEIFDTEHREIRHGPVSGSLEFTLLG